MKYEKKYKEALERAKKLQENSNGMILKKWLWNIFPELAESEDESIKKWIKKELESKYVVDSTVNNVMADKALAWLEKQGEHTDKAKPKFNVGDWIIHNDNKHIPIKIIEKIGMYYRIVDTHNYHHNILINCINKNYRLWTIKDAKDGDVLVSTWKGHSYIYIFKEIEGNAIVSHVYYYPEFDAIDMGVINMDNTPTVPATKEQRDSLMKAMTDAGYTFDFEKKELKKVEWEPQTGDTFRKKGTTSPTYHLCDKLEDGITFGFVENREVGISGGEITIFALRQDYELVERPKPIENVVEEELNKALQTKVVQKHSWSEEDEKVTKWVIDYIGNCPNESFDFYGGVGKEAVLSWLNKLKDILQPQPNQEWSEEDERKISLLDALCDDQISKSSSSSTMYREMGELKDWLKSFKDRVQPQPKQEWKQENTGDLNGFENAMMHIGESFFGKHAGLDPNDTNAIKEQANLLLELVPRQEWSEDGEAFYNKTIGLLKQYASDNEVRKQSAMSCINWLKSAIKHEKIAKYKIGDRVRFFSHAPIFTITGIDEANERYISQSGGFISFYEELIPAKGSLNKDDIKCGDYLTTEDGTVIKVHDIDENESVHHFYYASKMTEDGGDISNNFMYYCAILSDCRRSTQEEINFLEKWVAHKKYVWVKNNVSPYDEEED